MPWTAITIASYPSTIARAFMSTVYDYKRHFSFLFFLLHLIPHSYNEVVFKTVLYLCHVALVLIVR